LISIGYNSVTAAYETGTEDIMSRTLGEGLGADEGTVAGHTV
jgi:hypothetical protein